MTSRLQLFIICFVGFLDHMSIGLVFPIFAALLFDNNVHLVPPETSIEMRGFLYGALLALTPLAQFFSSPLLGAHSDRVGRKPALRIGISVAIAGYALAVVGMQMGSIALLLIYRLMVGVSDGSAAVAQAAIADISTEANKARNFSLFNGALGVGFTIGPFFGGLLSDASLSPWFGFTTPFAVTGCLCVINLIMIQIFYPDSSVKKSDVTYNVWDGLYNLKRAFQWKGLRTLFAATAAFSFGWAFYSEFIPVTLMNEFDFNTTQIGQYFAYNGIWYALSAGILTAPLLRRFGPEQLAIKTLFITSAYMLIFLLFDSALYLWFYIPVLMFLLAIVFPTMAALVSNATDSDKQGQVLGVYQSVSAFAFGISPFFGGSIIAAYPDLTIWGGSLAMLLSGIIFLWGKRHAHAK